MPIYEYRCDACGNELEALQKISDAPLTECPACASDRLRRLISKPSFRLKGSGWYETDFKSDKEKKRNLAASKDDKPKSGDDKPAAKESKSDDGGAKAPSGKKDSGTAAA
ncbi:MAG TPA: zinc ribbon domain-containing protein [Gammaproteobacteria bacterium]|nr:zinc ribbon domain-containing protein [Gammaproteobacteria bacterium]